MKQQLLRDILIVFGFWFVVAYYASGFPITLIPNVAKGVLLIWLVGGCVGLSAAWCARRWFVNQTQRKLGSDVAESDHASASIMDGDAARTLHRVNLPVPPPPERGSEHGNPLHALDWWPAFAQQHPAHAAVINDTYAVMQSRPNLPAGVDHHIGTTLAEHSMNVVEKILALAPDWKFDGIKNTRGTIIIPLNNPDGDPHTFGTGTVLDNPILPVAAFAHDLGKVECLVMENGKPVEMRPGHGEKGAEMLRRLPSVAALGMGDRDALLLSVKYYHHPSHIPLAKWIGDRPRSLTALLYEADVRSAFNRARDGVAGRPAEGGPTAAPAPAPTPGPTVAPAPAPGSESESKSAPASTPAAEQDTPAPPESKSTAPEGEATAAAPAPAYTSESGLTPLDALTELLSEHKRINGTSKLDRLAWKYGDWVYVSVDQLAALASQRLADKSIAGVAAGRSPFMATLLESLAERQWLYRGSPARAPAKSIWTAASSSSGDTRRATKYQAIVVSAALAPYCNALDDCTYPPLLLDDDAGELATPPAPKPRPTAPTKPDDTPDPDDFEAAFRNCMEHDQMQQTDQPRSDTVAFRSNKKAPGAIPKETLTAGILVQMAHAAQPLYGMERREVNGANVLIFDVFLLQNDFEFDPEEAPKGTKYATGKVDGKLKVVVRAP